ncbi:hypothetical protein J5N97_024306 [Dioscorea zingiberensis]|uniref:Uncharacterized protein n=1 Tax=Dioscorea zingiberensis TaxID=325984 RepID=A0A9D5C6U5_9LILI|nr:hypothetical protein J5N97_024306 [Dioscorea zingiberensis]
MDGQFGWGTLEDGWRKGPWTPQEDKLLIEHVNLHGEGRPDLKRGKITPQEESIILDLHARWGNRWSTIARSLPGRTDNEIKNYWRTHFKKGKTSKNAERARARFLKQQQEQQQQQQQQPPLQVLQLQVDQEQQQQYNNIYQQNQVVQPIGEQAYIDEMIMAYMNPNPMSSSMTSMSEGSSEDGAWGSLWNLDDVQHNAVQDQVLYFY